MIKAINIIVIEVWKKKSYKSQKCVDHLALEPSHALDELSNSTESNSITSNDKDEIQVNLPILMDDIALDNRLKAPVYDHN